MVFNDSAKATISTRKSWPGNSKQPSEEVQEWTSMVSASYKMALVTSEINKTWDLNTNISCKTVSTYKQITHFEVNWRSIPVLMGFSDPHSPGVSRAKDAHRCSEDHLGLCQGRRFRWFSRIPKRFLVGICGIFMDMFIIWVYWAHMTSKNHNDI